MNSLQNFKAIVDGVFGPGSAKFDTTATVANAITGALHNKDFDPFRTNFSDRLKRLAGIYRGADGNRIHLLNTVNEVASQKNWEGAYAELTAFDFFNSDKDWLGEPIELSKTMPAQDALAGAFGQQASNVDGYYRDFDLCFDVKVLSDKSKAILTSVTERALARVGLKGVHIQPEYPIDADYEKFQQNINTLTKELEQQLDPTTKPRLIRSAAVPELSSGLRGARE